MLPDELMASIERLPLDEKVSLLEALMRAIDAERHRASNEQRAAPDATDPTDLLRTDGPLPSFEKLRGILATNPPIPNDYDWKDDYADYLSKKYA